MNALVALEPTNQTYRPVRALNRGLRVLQVINEIGSGNLSQICAATNLPYATVIRLINTLMEAGFVEKEPGRKFYRATAMVKSLASGRDREAQLVETARPHIERLTERFGWPVSIATRVGSKMVLQDSTHRLTSLTFWNYAPGYTLPIAECATGKIYLAYSSPEELALIRRGLALSDDPEDCMAMLLTSQGALREEIVRKGYATQSHNNFTNNPGKTSSIAVPIVSDGVLIGAMAIVFFSVSMPISKAEAKFAAEMQAAARDIAAGIA